MKTMIVARHLVAIDLTADRRLRNYRAFHLLIEHGMTDRSRTRKCYCMEAPLGAVFMHGIQGLTALTRRISCRSLDPA
ncbi:hypothetical protein SBBP2_1720009 [Burkholderiales bacterium]|nr:hypothetical protein SBBP2_1720009 [Burkholderiales bacterium]